MRGNQRHVGRRKKWAHVRGFKHQKKLVSGRLEQQGEQRQHGRRTQKMRAGVW